MHKGEERESEGEKVEEAGDIILFSKKLIGKQFGAILKAKEWLCKGPLVIHIVVR